MSISYANLDYSRNLLEYFGEDGIRSKRPFNKIEFSNIILLCFTNRSGSNAISEDISYSFEFRFPGEVLNSDVIIKQSKLNKFTTYEEYLHFTFKKFSGKKLLLKISIDQLIFLHKYKFLVNFFISPNYVFVSRNDLLSQAVSYFIASNTLEWSAVHKTIGPTPDFDLEKIVGLTQHFSFENSKFKAFFCLLNIKPFLISYEAYLKNRGLIIKRLSNFLRLEPSEKESPKKKYLKQGTKVKIEYRIQVLSHFKELK
jgi:hypothetical protein